VIVFESWQRELTQEGKIITGSMMSSYQSGISLWCIVSTISDWSAERSSQSSPVVGGEEIKVFVERWLRLVLDDLHDLVDSIQPVLVDEG